MTPALSRSSLLARNPIAAARWLAGALAILGATACGDGKDVFLGTKSEVPLAPEGGLEGGVDGGTDVTNPDSTSVCASGDPIPLPMLELLEGNGDPSRRDRVGFGGDATGGKDGCLYTVTDFTDEIPARRGTLRFALERSEALWVVFGGAGINIELKDNLRPLSNKTIDGRNTSVTLRNYGIDIAGQENLVIANLAFFGDLEADAAPDANDAIALRGSRKVWIDHCTFYDYGDGLIDVTQGSTDVTISWSHFHRSQFQREQKVMLLGSEDDTEDILRSEMRVTLHHNWFDHTYTYNPRIRWGKVHTFNNLLDKWGDYGAGAGDESKLYSERNVYFSGADTMEGSDEAIKTDFGDEVPGLVWSEQDSFLGGAVRYQSQGTPEQVFLPPYAYSPSPVAEVLTGVPAGAGVRP